MVNVSVLVLRRDPVDHEHFVAPRALPILGVVVSLAVLATQEPATFLRAGILLAIGVALWCSTSASAAADVSGAVEDCVRPDPPPEDRRLAVDLDPLPGCSTVGVVPAPRHLPYSRSALHVLYPQRVVPGR
jgi:hypothetical protein